MKQRKMCISTKVDSRNDPVLLEFHVGASSINYNDIPNLTDQYRSHLDKREEEENVTSDKSRKIASLLFCFLVFAFSIRMRNEASSLKFKQLRIKTRIRDMQTKTWKRNIWGNNVIVTDNDSELSSTDG